MVKDIISMRPKQWYKNFVLFPDIIFSLRVRKMVKDIIISMRPKQWYKNFVLFTGIIFSSNLFNVHMWITVLFSFFIFCIISGSEYIINDIMDKERDKIHPIKCNRPIASGKLDASHALIFAVFILCGAFVGAYLMSNQFLGVSLAYFVLIVLYSLFLKHIAIVDVLTISSGFVLRAIAGCLAIKVSVSPWLIVCAFLVALFLALGKRMHELILLENGANNHRKVFEDFSSETLDKMITIVTSSLIMSYSLYTFLTDNNLMMVTIPIIIYGIFRYIFLIHSKNMGGEPEMLFKDKGMLTSMVLWIISVFGVLYINIQ
ncbi:MAG: decaprenyl-phosphate phosphoribosyltransferase [Methanosarcina barkeri]|nr:decaprenyl-phosphate phosphoribosyltransferase [Methanosarcina sp. ERenArc_MAG2]